MNTKKFTSDGHCFVCGSKNPYGLKLAFNYAEGKITAEFKPSKLYQGYKDITHCGIITAVLDESIIKAAIAEGMHPVTIEINVKFKKPLSVNEVAVVQAEITNKTSKVIEGCAKMLRKSDGVLIAEANAKLIQLK
jgi:acyl-coenzyme A thioesterase PaaI-like protein